jgi:hypothetical protein
MRNDCKLTIGNTYKHCFDLGDFIFVIDHKNGTGTFSKRELYPSISPIIGGQYVVYNLEEMKQ